VTGDVASLQEYPQPIIIKETEVQGSTETVNIVSIEDSSHPSGLSLVTVSTSIISKNIDARLPPQTVQTLAFTAPLSPRLISQRPGSTFDITESKTTIEQHEYAFTASPNSSPSTLNSASRYTEYWRLAPPKSYVQSLSLFPGRLSDTPYHLILLRPFILFAYPSIIWSSLIYACSVGWLIVLSESISALYRNRDTYNFTAFQTGLVYISAFVGGVLGTAIAGKCSDFVVKFMAKRNAGVYEPEFRLVMIIPVAVCSVAGLIGFGWSIEERDAWIVPTVFFGLISFGCSLGSTVAISFAVDCYREFAGEALVTMNFSKSKSVIFSRFYFFLCRGSCTYM
jgi:hypothetical protein